VAGPTGASGPRLPEPDDFQGSQSTPSSIAPTKTGGNWVESRFGTVVPDDHFAEVLSL
jgi:hypothetical protein